MLKKHGSKLLNLILAATMIALLAGNFIGVRYKADDRFVTIALESDLWASTTADYTVGAANADVQIQAALNALPATGGVLNLVSTGTYQFNATVTRNIANVTIVGSGLGTSLVYDGVNPIFSTASAGWVIRDLTLDAGGVSITGATYDNVQYGGTYYAHTKTGRATTIMVAASNANINERLQADYLADGTADQDTINTAVAALPAAGGQIVLSSGTFTLSNNITLSITGSGGIKLTGQGAGATILSNGNVAADKALVINSMYFADIGHLSIVGNAASGDGIYLASTVTVKRHIYHDLELRANGGWGFSAIQTATPYGVIIEKNWIEGNALGGIKTPTGSYAWWIRQDFIDSNTGTAGIDASVGMGHVIEDNIISANAGWQIIQGSGSATRNTMSYNAAGAMRLYGPTAGNAIVGDNRFVGHNAGDIGLQIDSSRNVIEANYFDDQLAGDQSIVLGSQATYNIVKAQNWQQSRDATAVIITNTASNSNVVEDQNYIVEQRSGITGYTNMLLNSGFEIPNAHWTASGGTRSSNTTGYRTGTRAMQLTSAGANSYIYQFVLPFAASATNSTYTLGAWLKAPSTNANTEGRLRLRYYGGAGTIVVSAPVPKDNLWHWATVTAIAAENITAIAAEMWSSYGTVSTDVLLIDDAVLVAGSVAPAPALPSSLMTIYNHDGDVTLTAWESGNVIHTNYGAGGSSNLTLPEDPIVGTWYHFSVQNTNAIFVDPTGGDRLWINGTLQAANVNARSTVVGSDVTFLYLGSSIWMATSVTGTWTVTP